MTRSQRGQAGFWLAVVRRREATGVACAGWPRGGSTSGLPLRRRLRRDMRPCCACRAGAGFVWRATILRLRLRRDLPALPPGPRRVWRNSPRPGGAGFLWRTCNPGLRFAGAGLNPSRRFATDGGSSGPRREAANGFQPRAEPETAAEVPRAQAAAKAKPWVPSATPISSPEGAAGGPPPRCGRRHIRPRSGRQDVARWRRPSPGARTSPGFAKDHIPSCPSRPPGPQGLPVRPIA